MGDSGYICLDLCATNGATAYKLAKSGFKGMKGVSLNSLKEKLAVAQVFLKVDASLRPEVRVWLRKEVKGGKLFNVIG